MKNFFGKKSAPVNPGSVLPVLPFSMNRRLFLQWAGMTSAAGVLLSSCKNDMLGPDGAARTGIGADVDVNLGSGDVGILNYAYALEQLEATFYERVVANPYSGMSAMERSILMDIRDHEVAHREFFKAALGSAAIPALAIDFPGVNFNSRDSILQTARTFEDLGVAAYNGAGQLLSDMRNLNTAGKIVSVEARHAAIIRELISPNSRAFAGDDVVDPASGLDKAMKPGEVAPAAQTFIKQGLIASNLPTM